jgi:hypothetical protein
VARKDFIDEQNGEAGKLGGSQKPLGVLMFELNYASLYSDALNDPLLKRTRVELETAMSNAVEARKVVFELFQDLDGFWLDDYTAMGKPSPTSKSAAR